MPATFCGHCVCKHQSIDAKTGKYPSKFGRDAGPIDCRDAVPIDYRDAGPIDCRDTVPIDCSVAARIGRRDSVH